MEIKSLLSDTGKSLKDQNRWMIRSYVAIHAVLACVLALGPEPITALVEVSSDASLKAAVPAFVGFVATGVASIILLGLLPASWRDHIVHFRLKHPLPGSRAFTAIAPKDSRISMDQLRSKLGELPSDPAVQNHTWYKLYIDVQESPGVKEAHRNYLAARDLAWVTWILLVLFGGLVIAATNAALSASIYALGMLFLACLISLVAQNYGVRFVQNVLAVTSAANVEIGTTMSNRPAHSSGA